MGKRRSTLKAEVGDRVIVITGNYDDDPAEGDILVVDWKESDEDGDTLVNLRQENDKNRTYEGWALYTDEFRILENECAKVSPAEAKNAKPWKTVEELTSFLRDRFKGIDK